MDAEVRLLVEGPQQRDAVREALVETRLQLSLQVFLADRAPRLDRLPHEDQDDPTRVGVVEPHLLRQERDVVDTGNLGLTEGPDLVVDLQEVVDVLRVDLEDEHLHRQMFAGPKAEVTSNAADRIPEDHDRGQTPIVIALAVAGVARAVSSVGWRAWSNVYSEPVD